MAHLLDIGTWSPGFGVNLTDVIFPHIAHGFRGTNLPIATYHVGKRSFNLFILIFLKEVLLELLAKKEKLGRRTSKVFLVLLFREES